MSDEAIDQEDEETYSAIRTVLGSTHRTARWHLTDEVDVLTALGRSSFDLRLVETTGRAIAEISVTCILGSVTLVVPPGTLVVLDGNSFLARAVSNVEPGAVSELPRIEVTATTVLGRVKVVSRDPEAVVIPSPEAKPVTEPVDEAPTHEVSVNEAGPDETPVHEAQAVDEATEDGSAAPIAS